MMASLYFLISVMLDSILETKKQKKMQIESTWSRLSEKNLFFAGIEFFETGPIETEKKFRWDFCP